MYIYVYIYVYIYICIFACMNAPREAAAPIARKDCWEPRGSSSRFIRGSLRPATDEYVRHRGRPRKEGVPKVMANAMRLFGSPEEVQQAASDKSGWFKLLNSKFQFHSVP